MDPDPRQNEVAVNGALPAVTLNFQNEERCELSDKIMYPHILVLYSVFFALPSWKPYVQLPDSKKKGTEIQKPGITGPHFSIC